jgi:hypothetical protein
MKTSEAIARGFNLMLVAIIALAGFAFAAELFLEDERLYKIDDIALLLLSFGSIWWYTNGRNRFRVSLAPVLMICVALLIKIGALVVEFSDAADVGDDFGGVSLFILSVIFVLYQYRKTKKLVTSVQ